MSDEQHAVTPDDARRREPEPPGRRSPRGPVLLGMFTGVLAVGGLAFVVSSMVARSDLKSDQAMAPQARAGAAGGTWEADPHQADQPVAGAAAGRIRELREVLLSDPSAMDARRELARQLIDNGDWVGGFNEARTLLRDDPDDAVGLLIEGLVRMRMGQNEEGLLLIDRLLANRPDDVEALRVRGLGLLRMGDSLGAIASWERALLAAGGRQPEIERLLAVSRAALGETASETAPSAPAATALPASLASVIGAEATAIGGSSVAANEVSFPVAVKAPGVDATGQTLFASLVEEEGGPPVLVRRIVSPRFPLRIALSAADNMMGDGDVPATGTLRIRLDADGDAGTRGPRDLMAETQARRGSAVTVVLR